jgi:hypothetical protein
VALLDICSGALRATFGGTQQLYNNILMDAHLLIICCGCSAASLMDPAPHLACPQAPATIDGPPSNETTFAVGRWQGELGWWVVSWHPASRLRGSATLSPEGAWALTGLLCDTTLLLPVGLTLQGTCEDAVLAARAMENSISNQGGVTNASVEVCHHVPLPSSATGTASVSRPGLAMATLILTCPCDLPCRWPAASPTLPLPAVASSRFVTALHGRSLAGASHPVLGIFVSCGSTWVRGATHPRSDDE